MSVGDAGTFRQLSREARALLEKRVGAFEAAWTRGDRPSVADYLPETDPTEGRLLIELLHADVEFRVKAGESVRIDDYLGRFPSLGDRSRDVEELRAVKASLQQSAPGPPILPLTSTGKARLTLPLRSDAASAEIAASLREQPRVGRFEIERVLGRGGYGVVYLAFDPALGRHVAIKVPHPHVLGDASLKDRFLREARAAASLDHPNVVPVLEVGEERSNCFLVSAYCPGENLGEWMAKQADPIPLQTAAAIVSALADAVEFSHARGVLHRDLKPANVMLDPRVAGPADGGEELLPFVPRLTDFGLAKIVEAGLTETRTSVVLGTPVYMSPEQADGISEVGPPADIYSLGVILFELLTGRVPFQGSLATVLEQVRDASPPAPSRLRPDLPVDLETICLKCLHKQPRHRYHTAGELAEDLRRFLDGRPITGRRLTVLQKFTNWARHPNRLRDAGAYGIALNTAFLIWMPCNATLTAIDWHSVAAFHLHAEMIRTIAGIAGSVAVAFSMHVPMVFISRQTMRRKRWAPRVGIALSVVMVAVAIAAWIRLIVLFGGLYSDDRLRTTIFSLLVPLFAAQLAGFVAAEAAVRRLRS